MYSAVACVPVQFTGKREHRVMYIHVHALQAPRAFENGAVPALNYVALARILLSG